ncbi:MAG: zinc-ribbon domain-containing protein [Candidatus Lokiarchaeota archaeon]|nr:zinc-ribbon domain-containing protein [Candidatus Lokiarchaeota archaeon]
MAYSTYQRFSYSCMECNKTLASSIDVKKCRKCSMELCRRCYTKHGGVCSWCLEAAADEPLWLVKLAKILMALSPVFGFLVPSPVPIAFLLPTNPMNWLWAAVYTGVFLIVFGILLGSAKAAALKSIVVKIPPRAAPTQARDETPQLQPAPSMQTQTTTSMAEQPYNPQLGNVQMDATPLHGAAARAQEPSLVFDIAGTGIDVAEAAPAGGSGPAAVPPEVSLAGGEADAGEREAPPAAEVDTSSAGDQADHPPAAQGSPLLDASEEPGDAQDSSISSLDAQLFSDISGGEDRPPEVPIAAPDGATTASPAWEQQEGIPPTAGSEEGDTNPPAVQGGDASGGWQEIEPFAELPLDEQAPPDIVPEGPPQAVPAGDEAAAAPEEEGRPASEPMAPAVGAQIEDAGTEAVIQDQGEVTLITEEPTAGADGGSQQLPAVDAGMLPPADRSMDGPPPLKCPNCGRALDDSDVFCPNCGFEVQR